MAAAVPPPLASSVEKTNGAKLSRLLIDGGTTVLRAVFDRYHPPANLLADLHANYFTLNNLLRRRVLHRPQWDLLFPPGGGTPDSNTFDITLLFLLLTNICGLSRPLSFWHSKPPPSDTSLEANFARIKFFRNALYGHAATTGVDTPTFSALWLEISAVLVALGLHQAEIDRLKAERCGEEDYIDVLLEWADSEEDIKSQLKDFCQVVTDVRQTQIDDSRAIQQMCQSTEHGVAKLHEVHTTLQDTKSEVEKVSQSHGVLLKTQEEGFKALQQQLKERTENLEGQRAKHRQDDEILKKLAKIDSLKDMKHHAERYVEGTRVPILKKVECWLDDRSSPNRVMVVSGTAGMGKSVISAKMCQKLLKAGRLAGSHFCQHDRARHRNPKVMLQSLASHLADSFPDYKKALEGTMSRNLGVEINDMEVKDLFELLFEEPLTSLNDPGLTYLMVIDGIDESEYQGRNELLDVISNYFQTLPLWIRFLVTTRPEINIAENLKDLQPLQLEPNVEENLKDIHLCLKKYLGSVLQSEYQDIILQALVKKSEGVMLYAHYLVDFIKEKVPLLTPELLDSTLPSGISSVYQSYFKRLETELCKKLKVTEEQFMNILSAVAAAREPLPLGFVSKLLLSGKSSSAVQRKVNAAIGCVSALLPVQDGRIHFFHKSVKDWLNEKSNYGQHHFSVDEKEGHQVLSKLCIDELDDLKRKGADGAQLSDTTEYALQHGVQHMLQLEEDERLCSLEDVAKKYCLDLELVYAKLCVGVTASEDILSVQKLEGVEALFEKWQTASDTVLYLLRKHISTLTECPRAIFQTLFNEGGPELSSEALNLLETRHAEIPYMEFLHKKDLQGPVQSRFQCSAEVACFDVSPKYNYMVCECTDGTIQLWSLRTGKQLWKNHVKVSKYYKLDVFDRDVYQPTRTGPSTTVMSFYRSVVFHPTEDLVLPGILSHAYTFDGDLKPLFLLSNCCFSICSISADKTKMLTDCPDNAKSTVMWSLTDGSEISHFAFIEDILSFAWSQDGKLLAISHTSGRISLVNVVDGFKTLAQATTEKVCGMIKFSPDCRFLFGLHFASHFVGYSNCLFGLQVKMENECNFSSDVFPDDVSYNPWDLESRTETGFLLGDPFCCPYEQDCLLRPAFAFVLNEQFVLRVSNCSNVIELLHLDELKKDRESFSNTIVRKVAFSLNGATLYVLTEKDMTRGIVTLMAWDISNAKCKAEKSVGIDCNVRCWLLAVRAGVLYTTSSDTLELWNFELSECIRSWTDLGKFHEVSPISEEQVACAVWSFIGTPWKEEVVILDTTSGDIMSRSTIHGNFVACNSKYQVITTTKSEYDELQMHCGEVVLWKISEPLVYPFLLYNTFSPTGQYYVVGGDARTGQKGDQALYVLDALSGRALNTLCTFKDWLGNRLDCKFVSDEECVVSFNNLSEGYCLRLFNVKSGDLLSVIALESRPFCLAACPRTRLIAVGFEISKLHFKVLQVKLPRDKDNKENKRISFKSEQ